MTPRQPRQSKTPAQRAQEAVDVLERRIARLTDKRKGAEYHVTQLDRELAENQSRLEYARQNPDLPTTPTTGATR